MIKFSLLYPDNNHGQRSGPFLPRRLRDTKNHKGFTMR